MFQKIIQYDVALLKAINAGHSPALDVLMWFVSKTYFWIPLYILLAIMYLKYYSKKNFPWIVLTIIILIAASDQMASTIIKPLAHRLRPTHNPLLENSLHIVDNYRGGLYGFVSSHAANSFALMTFVIGTLKQRWLWTIMIFYACLTSYSRIYLGVHYPLDIIGGAIIGIALSCFAIFVLKKKAVI